MPKPLGSTVDHSKQDMRAHFDPLFRALLLMFILGFGLILYRANQTGLELHNIIQLALSCICVMILVLRHRLPLGTVTTVVLAALFVTLIAGIVRLGLGASGLLVLVVIPIFVTTLISFRAAQVTLLGITVSILAVGYFFVQGTLSAQDVSQNLNNKASNWIFAASVFTLSSYMAIYITHRLRKYWGDTVAQLQRRHDEINTLIEYAPEAIMIYDLDKNSFVRANSRASALFGYSVDALTNGKSLTDLYTAPEDGPGAVEAPHPPFSFDQRMRAALEGKTPLFETQVRPSDGAPIACEISLSHLPPFDRRLIRFTTTDIRARKQAELDRISLEAQLAQAQRLEAVGKLSGGVAHDFNNLLAVILGNVELLRDQLHDPDQLEMIETIVGSVRRGADLTQDMLSFARRARLMPQILDLNDVVNDIDTWAGRTLPANVSVEMSLKDDLWPIKADLSALQNALLNLLINARDAMPEGGHLRIETSNQTIGGAGLPLPTVDLTSGRYVCLSVSDTGCGIPADTLAHIFDPFFTTKPVGKGSGLGLSMVQGFMKQSGGAAQAISEIGNGTTFQLWFRAAQDVQPAPLARPATPVGKSGDGQSILIAEDEPEIRDLLVTMLRNAGYRVEAAASGDEAYDLYQRSPEFDLLLTDVVMPGKLQGVALAQAVRDVTPQLPVIFLSGYVNDGTVSDFDLQPDDIRLMKPLDRSALLAALDQALGR